MDIPDDRPTGYEYHFDHTHAGDLRMPRAKYRRLVDAYSRLRDVLQQWNERVPSETGAEAPYPSEVADLDRMIRWSDDELSRGQPEVVVRGISVGSLRYAKAAMLLQIGEKQQHRAVLAEKGWPSSALRSVDNDIAELQGIADGISQEPCGVLQELASRPSPSVTGNEPSPTTSSNGSNELHLENLSISGFRGIDALTIPKLGRVTLLAGRNGVGKTTVLDAVRAYAARGRPDVLVDLLERHEELARQLDEDGDVVDLPDIAALFHARDPRGCISIGPVGDGDVLGLEMPDPMELPGKLFAEFARMGLEPDVEAIKVQFNGVTAYLPGPPALKAEAKRVRHHPKRGLDDDLPEAITCNLIGPDTTPNKALAKFWDEVVLEPEEELVVEALRLVLERGLELERVAVLGPASGGSERRFVAGLKGGKRAPLASFGDGAMRLLGIALTLVRSRGGFLVIDEAENGIHHSIQQDFWHLVIKGAIDYNVQVLATTHSKDCIDGFGRAAKDLTSAEGVLLRLERHNGQLRAVQYVEEDIVTAADQRIETR